MCMFMSYKYKEHLFSMWVFAALCIHLQVNANLIIPFLLKPEVNVFLVHGKYQDPSCHALYLKCCKFINLKISIEKYLFGGYQLNILQPYFSIGSTSFSKTAFVEILYMFKNYCPFPNFYGFVTAITNKCLKYMLDSFLPKFLTKMSFKTKT